LSGFVGLGSKLLPQSLYKSKISEREVCWKCHSAALFAAFESLDTMDSASSKGRRSTHSQYCGPNGLAWSAGESAAENWLDECIRLPAALGLF
jgi:hypothetical protein